MEWVEENKLIDFLKSEKYKAKGWFFDNCKLHTPEHWVALANYENIASLKIKAIDKADTPLFERIITEVDTFLVVFMDHAEKFKELIQKAVKNRNGLTKDIAKRLPSELLDDEEFMFETAKINEDIFAVASERLKDSDEFILRLDKNSVFIDPKYWSDRLKNATRNNGYRALGILAEIQNDPDYLASKTSHQAKKALEIKQNIEVNSQKKKKRFLFF